MSKSKERIKQTGEVFTPPELVEKLLNQIPEEKFQNADSKFLDNAAGDGNFLVCLKDKLLTYGHSEEHILDNMMYAVELMEDNHKILCDRIGVPHNHPHYVCENGLEYDYSFGQLQNLDKFFS